MVLSERYIQDVQERYSMFTDMATVLEERKGEQFELIKFTVTEEEVINAKRFDRYGEYRDFIPGEYVKLIDKKANIFENLVMSDTQMERATNLDLYNKANGHVLIGGLGIGMILLAIQDKPEVTKITVVEKYKEVIDLVGSQLPLNEKVEIVHSDIFEYKPKRGSRFDTIYMDIWNTVSAKFWSEHMELSRKFNRRKNKVNPDSWSSSWRRKDYKYMANY